MRTATKLSAYGVALAVIAGGAWVIGAAAGPVGDPAGAEGHSMSAEMATHAEDGLPGLAVAANGYRLELERNQVSAGIREPFRFRVLDQGGAALTRFTVQHEKLLHLVLVRRDGSGYQHLHPELTGDGVWSVPLTVPAAGSYRVFTDFSPEGGTKTVLGADIQAAGDYRPRAMSPQRTDTVDGYQVRLAGDLVPGKESQLTATITSDGQPVRDLQPYLGAYGHLVALRAADLGYLHVHPLGDTEAGPEVRFGADVPTPGRYRLYLDFQHNGTVRTAEFTVDTTQETHS